MSLSLAIVLRGLQETAEEAGERPLLALAIGIAIGSVSAALLAVRIRASCSLLALHSHRSPHKIAE